MDIKPGQTISINWRLADKTKGLTGVEVSDTVCVVKEVYQTCFKETMVKFVDTIYTPVRIERVKVI